MIVFGARKIDKLVEMRQRPQGMKIRKDGTLEVTAAGTLHDCVCGSREIGLLV